LEHLGGDGRVDEEWIVGQFVEPRVVVGTAGDGHDRDYGGDRNHRTHDQYGEADRGAAPAHRNEIVANREVRSFSSTMTTAFETCWTTADRSEATRGP
jgi:hypothetical protein